jgi:hypothetical protein
MGITISYSGKLRDPSVIPELIADVTAMAEAAGWHVKSMEELIAEGRVTCSGLRGVSIWPHPQSEPVRLHFDDEGNFINPAYYALLVDPAQAMEFFAALARPGQELPREPPQPGEIEFFREGSRHVWTKTQHAGARGHVAVCALLRHVKQRYAPGLRVKDDSGYFETGDYARLEGELATVDHLIGRAREAFVTAGREGVTSMDALVQRAGQELFRPKDSPN